MLTSITFLATAALFVLGTLACLWHLRWMRRLPGLSEFTHPDEASASRSNIRCSIVVASRDEQTRVEDTVRRLLAQTHVEVELIVVNDRSTDRTGEILNQLARENSRLKVIHQEPVLVLFRPNRKTLGKS
jgi:cellulose synthase/poly-beta-1,6-N-acetylglucosamine synthase-like glycosyltransferase